MISERRGHLDPIGYLAVPLIIGFDLDMTLLDTRAGIAAAFRELSARTGVPIDADLVVTRLGPPLRTEMANWFPPDEVDAAVATYRGLYAAHAIPPTVELPGARSAVQAVHDRGGRVMVVTSKHQPLAVQQLAHVGLVVDEVHGDVFAEEKGVVLKEAGARAYIGDHVADMRAGTVAEIHPVGVVTGPCSREDLFAAGAEVVLDDLCGFPAWLEKLA
jgi:phosphoglycolate phosphatase